MRLHELTIKNFRGIKKLRAFFPEDSALACLIGAGDAGKSTVLSAVEWVFWPRYSLSVGDIDFFGCDTRESIEITAIVSGFPDELIREDKFGLYQRRIPGGEHDQGASDDPAPSGDTALAIRLTIREDLEPQWDVIKGDRERKRISAADRARMPVCRVDGNGSRDSLWGRQSLLQRYASAKDAIKATSILAARELSRMALPELDEATEGIPGVVEPFGVSLSEGEISNRFIMSGSSTPAQVGLFDGPAPVSLLGEGSRKLFSIALGMRLASTGSLLLIDEIEGGLEPHRLRNLISQLRSGGENGGSQALFTTHSPVVLQELCHGELYSMCKRRDASTSIHRLSSDDAQVRNDIQAQLRRSPDAFLSERVIVCEGQTEVGIVRALDRYQRGRNKRVGIAAMGVCTSNAAGGNNMFKYARHLVSAGYETCIFMDSDVDYSEEKTEMESLSVRIFDWENGLSTERQVFKCIPDEGIREALRLAVELHGEDSIRDQLSNHGLSLSEVLGNGVVSGDARCKLGHQAHAKGWYKSETNGELLGQVILRYIDNCSGTKLGLTLENLLEWSVE